VHFKAVIVDGARVYLGSANWTGAGLGAKNEGRRNFELGFMTSDEQMLDEVQALYENVWRGGTCSSCRMRELCDAPIDELLKLGRASKAEPIKVGRVRKSPPPKVVRLRKTKSST
jgi:phosphatidylserine/phosphatidylglycerophosphate/cardiolipin synthase-like enzyme